MARCKHTGSVQQFTEICMDCGHNIYETDAEYEESLRREISRLKDDARTQRIDDLEKIKEDLERELHKNDDDNNSGW
jgi:primosomal protein N'